MTIEQLLGKKADELDKLTYEELEIYFRPYFPVTRPELQEMKQPKLKKFMGVSEKAEAISTANDILKQLGFKVRI